LPVDLSTLSLLPVTVGAVPSQPIVGAGTGPGPGPGPGPGAASGFGVQPGAYTFFMGPSAPGPRGLYVDETRVSKPLVAQARIVTA
jgi:hypothetical protein